MTCLNNSENSRNCKNGKNLYITKTYFLNFPFCEKSTYTLKIKTTNQHLPSIFFSAENNNIFNLFLAKKCYHLPYILKKCTHTVTSFRFQN